MDKFITPLLGFCSKDKIAIPTLVEIDHEMISTDILHLPLIQEGLLSVTSKSMCTKYWLTL